VPAALLRCPPRAHPFAAGSPGQRRRCSVVRAVEKRV
jgi:hypothetical protein